MHLIKYTNIFIKSYSKKNLKTLFYVHCKLANWSFHSISAWCALEKRWQCCI